jgi:molybdopterin-binding protein
METDARAIAVILPNGLRRATGAVLDGRSRQRGWDQRRVTGVRTDDIMGEVQVEIEPATITAAIAASSVQRLGLKTGDQVTVIIKSTEVLIGK